MINFDFDLSSHKLNIYIIPFTFYAFDTSNERYFKKLCETRLKNPNKIIFEHVSINYLIIKFGMLQKAFRNNIDVLVISKTNLDNSFLINHI